MSNKEKEETEPVEDTRSAAEKQAQNALSSLHSEREEEGGPFFILFEFRRHPPSYRRLVSSGGC